MRRWTPTILFAPKDWNSQEGETLVKTVVEDKCKLTHWGQMMIGLWEPWHSIEGSGPQLAINQ